MQVRQCIGYNVGSLRPLVLHFMFIDKNVGSMHSRMRPSQVSFIICLLPQIFAKQPRAPAFSGTSLLVH